MTKIVQIPFMGENLPLAVTEDGHHYVIIKPICENIGLDAWGQQKKLQKQPYMNYRQLSVVAEDGKIREMGAIPANRVAAWLLQITSWFPEVNRKLDVYKEQAADVLDAWLFQKPMPSRGQMTKLPERTAKRALRPEAQKAVRYYRMGLRTAEIATLLGHTKSNVRTFLQVAEQLGLIVPDQKRLKGRGHIRHIPSRAHLTLVEG